MTLRFWALPALVLAACTAPEPEVSVIDTIMGKELIAGGRATITLAPDGTFSGTTARGRAVAGTYTASGNRLCSTITEPATEPIQLCSTAVLNETGDRVTLVRDNGTQVTYRIAG